MESGISQEPMIKEELTNNEELADVKSEAENEHNDNPFNDVELQIKQDYTLCIENEDSQHDENEELHNDHHQELSHDQQELSHDNEPHNYNIHPKNEEPNGIGEELHNETEELHNENEELIHDQEDLHNDEELDNNLLDLHHDLQDNDNHSSHNVNDPVIKNEEETILPTNDDEMKQELDENDDMDLVSYDYPNFDDSMDSSEAAALSHVEACLSEEVIKPDVDYDGKEPDNLPKIIKQENDLTVTETHIISNKVINTTSTLTNTHDGIIQSETTKTIIMEIQPLCHDNLNKLGNPEEILPTSNYNIETSNQKYDIDYGETFQLNSITSNILSLEQEAYGLLQTKKSKNTEEKVYLCPKCPKTFKYKSGRRRHMKIHDAIERRELGFIKGCKTKKDKKDKLNKEMEVAEIPLKTIKTKYNENKKVDIKEDIKTEDEVKIKPNKDGYICTCGQVFRRRSRMETCLRSHTLFHDLEQFKCASCDKKFKSNNDLQYHRNQHHRKRYPCKFCPTNYHSQKALFKHLQVHQQVQLTEFKLITQLTKENINLTCLVCKESCSDLSDLKMHTMEDHKSPYVCPHCNNQNFTKILYYISHVKKCHPELHNESLLDVIEAFSKLVKAWKCDHCGLQFYEADKLALHQMDDHTPDMKNEQHFQCEDCQRVFISIQGLHSHRRMHHRPEETEEVEPEEVGVMCLECRKICKDMTALTSHMRLHSMERKYPCKFCDFRFATPQKRKTHSEIHTGDMKYVCFICEYQCSSENRLKQHKMSVKHVSMKEYLLTGKPSIEEESKKDRKKEYKKKKKDKKDKKDTEEDREVICDICGEKFPSERAMDAHKQTHPFIEFPNEETPTRIFFK